MDIYKVYKCLVKVASLPDKEIALLQKTLQIIVDNRNDSRYNEDVFRDDASQRLAYGLCKEYGIDTTGMKPSEAWAALQDKTGKTANDFYSESGNAGANKVKFGTANKKAFVKALAKAKASIKKGAWRVTSLDKDELMEYHPNAKLHVTDGGSTMAIDNGDIVAVSHVETDNVSGTKMMELAVKNGGVKLDSYSGNHGFYLRCGFEPVSWCEWDDNFKPSDWSEEDGDAKEPIIFYKYTGKKVKMTKDEAKADAKKWMNEVKASKDYDEACSVRDKEIE